MYSIPNVASFQAMRRYTTHCESAITSNHPQGMVDNTSQVAAFYVNHHYTHP